MKKKLLFFIGFVVFCIVISECYSKYIYKENFFNQVSQFNTDSKQFDKWSVANKDVLYRYFTLLHHTWKGINLNSLSLSSKEGNIDAQFFISLHHLDITGKDHYSDLYFSFYSPYEIGGIGKPFSLYYSVDGEEPIMTKIRGYYYKNSVMYIHFRPNVYDFFRKCSNAKSIRFFVIDFEHETIIKEFNLIGLYDAYKYGLEQLNSLVNNSDS